MLGLQIQGVISPGKNWGGDCQLGRNKGFLTVFGLGVEAVVGTDFVSPNLGQGRGVGSWDGRLGRRLGRELGTGVGTGVGTKVGTGVGAGGWYGAGGR